MTFDEFINSYQKLKESLPRSPIHSLNNENCDFCGYTYNSQNCYYCFDCSSCQNCLYCFDCVRCNDCMDCDYCVEGENLYNCVDDYKVYNSTYLDYCARVYDSHFCWDCGDSHDLFGCIHLKQRQYCIFNKQYTKEEYQQKIKELLKRPVEENMRELKALIDRYPLGPTNITNSENSDYGNHVHYSRNCYLCFDSARNENCGYLFDSSFCKDSYDLNQCYKAELCYECSDSGQIYNCNYIEWSNSCFDSSYLYNCKDCHNCFGCIAIAHKRFCILNKQYTEEQYKKVIAEIRLTVH